jgi:alpha-L-arabinofuranosidase
MQHSAPHFSRRAILHAASVSVLAAQQQSGANGIDVDPTPLFDFSPHFYMQFMEPLGVTDGSVEACWNYGADDWRADVLETTKVLAPDVIRWGGLYCRYYRWREGIGPARQRKPMFNYVWSGWEPHRVGTHEFVDFCRRVNAEPLWCVNFASDGVERYRNDGRSGDAEEAADWVSYCNEPAHAERARNGHAEPFAVKLWQLGNETSYGNQTFTRDEAIRETIAFSRAMRKRDPSIKLIAWGDYGNRDGKREMWAPEMLRQAGEHFDLIAVHMMGMTPRRENSLLRFNRYQKDPEGAWGELLELSDVVETRVKEIVQSVEANSRHHDIAITEGHLSLPPHNANPLLLEWLSAAYHARTMNIYHRHGGKIRITTGADFAGNRWTVNAVLVQTPGRVSYPTPVASVMGLFKKHNGAQGIAVNSAPGDLDVAASRTGNRIYLHVLNRNFRTAVATGFSVKGHRIVAGRVYAIAPSDPRTAVNGEDRDVFSPRESALPGDTLRWQFPPTSVSAVELDLS